MEDTNDIHGQITVELRGPDGKLKHRETVRNLITDTGDAYYAAKAIVGISPANPSAPTAQTGMKLGTGTTSASKASTGAALGTYISASNVAFDSGYPQTSNLGSGLGVNAVYKTTWAAGTATNSAITEVVIVNDSSTNATSTAGNTIARAVFSAVNKASGDSLAVTWSHKFLGA